MISIRELAQEFGVSSAAIRHYEKSGLLDGRHITRGANGYRYFNDTARGRLRYIRLAQAAGFTLKELAGGLELWENPDTTPAQKKAIIGMQLRRVDEQIAQLQETRQYIAQKIDKL